MYFYCDVLFWVCSIFQKNEENDADVHKVSFELQMNTYLFFTMFLFCFCKKKGNFDRFRIAFEGTSSTNRQQLHNMMLFILAIFLGIDTFEMKTNELDNSIERQLNKLKYNLWYWAAIQFEEPMHIALQCTNKLI